MALNFNKQSLGEQIALMLKEKIHHQKFEGGMLPKEEDLALELNVSRGTIRSAMSILVDEELIVRVKKKGTFVNSDKVQQIEAPKFRRLNIIFNAQSGMMPRTDSSFYSTLINVMFEEANRQKYILNLGMVDVQNPSNNNFKPFIDDEIDGNILVAIEQEEVLAEFINTGKPTLLIDHTLDIKGLECFDFDSYAASRSVADYLLDNGHRKFIFLSHHRVEANPGRVNGVLDRLKEFGIPAEDLHDVKTQPKIVMGYEAIKRLRQELNEVTAIITFDSFMALGASRALKEFNLNIPNDVSVISCSNNIIEMGNTPMTTVEFDLTKFGQTAVKYIVERINGQVKSKISNAKGEIVDRGSVKKIN